MTTWAGHPPHKLRKFHFHVRFFPSVTNTGENTLSNNRTALGKKSYVEVKFP